MRPSSTFLRILLCGITTCVLSACFGNGEPNKTIMGQSDIKDSIVHEPEWSKVPALQRIPVSADLFLAHSVRPPMPADIATRKISLRFSKGDATVHDLIGVLDYQDVPVVIRSSGDTGLSEDDINDQVLPFRRYDGTIAGLVKRLGNSLDLSVWWENDSLYISDRDRYVISVPQNQQVIDNVIKELEDFGAEDVTPSMYGGRIVYSVRPAVNDELIKPYLNGLIGNLAEITLQLAVVQLNLTDASERGIDWSSLQVQFGDPAKLLAAGTATALGTPAALTASGLGDITSRGGSFADGVIGASAQTNLGPGSRLGVSGAILYLSQYGKTTTKQMVELRTLAGMKVQLQSLTTTPYVKGLSSTSSTASNSDNVTSSVDTATIDTGLSMSFTPYYDSVVGLVSVNVNIQLSSLVALKILSYGAPVNASTNTGTGVTGTTGTSGTSVSGTTGTSNSTTAPTQSSISQPQTQKSQITDIVRLPAGEVVILGGLKEENNSETRQSPLDEYDALGSKILNKSTTLTFFIMRPVVTIFDPKGSKVNTTLPGDPSDLTDRAFHDDTEAHPVTVIEPVTPPNRRRDRDDETDTHEQTPISPVPDVPPPAPKPVHKYQSKASVIPQPQPVDLMPVSVTAPVQTKIAAEAPATYDMPAAITQIENSVGDDHSAEAHGRP